MSQDPAQILEAGGWKLRPGVRPNVVVAEREGEGRRIYAGSPKEILLHLTSRTRKGKPNGQRQVHPA